MQSPILRLTGPINQINDSVIAGTPAFGNSTTVSKTSGQLGKWLWLDDSTIFYDSSVGTVYGGRFRYVRLAAAASAVAVGQLLFWDISVADSLFQVTTSEAGSDPGAQFFAGVNLNPDWEAGNYGVIQEIGPVNVKFRGTLTQVPAGVGVAVYAAAAGAGVDNGLADTIGTALPVDFDIAGLLQNRYLGAAIQLPTNGGTKLVYVNPRNLRG